MMTRFMSIAVFGVLLCGCGGVSECPYAALEKEGFVRLFDGESFAGWEGNMEVWRIEDGAIVSGHLDRDVPHNEYLCTVDEYGDFELRLKFKIAGGDTNAGVQIRSRRRHGTTGEMIGYQADIGQVYWGCLYDEGRRNAILVQTDQEKMAEVINKDGWNDYVIRCEGKRIQLWLNGYQTVDYTEANESFEQVGLIGLQVHQGPPSEARYKDIVLKQL